MIYILLNLIGLLIMYLDKQFAIKGMRRVPEKTLFLISFLGAGIGVWSGMYLFRHKTKKTSFIILVPLSVLLNIILFYSLIKIKNTGF